MDHKEGETKAYIWVGRSVGDGVYGKEFDICMTKHHKDGSGMYLAYDREEKQKLGEENTIPKLFCMHDEQFARVWKPLEV